MKPVLHIDRLIGGYSMNKPVLHEISMKIYPGEMVGLIGLNGAGKSTTIKHILGLMKPHKGTVQLNGLSLQEDPQAYRSVYGYVPESPIVYEEMTVKEHLEMTALSRGMTQQTMNERLGPLMERFRMTKHEKQLSAHLSKGMKQKLMIMNAFLAEPELYIIDEPFLGLDPLAIRSLLNLMVDAKESGSAILMSSHILSTIEQYCNRFLILHQGHLVAQGTLEELREKSGLKDAGLERLFEYFVLDGIEQ
ncbi:ABC transporter ATP-binding protein [Marinicrinis lubricantis]|uniref:ABC transporter ATP-binding protein n=1 Tax=Marinicrinis lubricantis TaxID=2086470 RepID=A0ABW1IUE6_9BACL